MFLDVSLLSTSKQEVYIMQFPIRQASETVEKSPSFNIDTFVQCIDNNVDIGATSEQVFKCILEYRERWLVMPVTVRRA